MKNVAIVGYGGQGAWHADQILKSDVCTLAGIYDIKENRRQAAKEKGIKVYNNNEEIFNDENVVKAVDNKEESLIKLDEVLRVMRVVEKAKLSDKKGQRIKTEI